MKIRMIKEALDASVIEGEDKLDMPVEHVYASDLMSDVLAFGKPNSILLTGLASQQSIISAHMAEFKAVVLIRGKKTRDGARDLARENDMILMSTDLDMYDACSRISSRTESEEVISELTDTDSESDELSVSRDLFIEGSDFSKAGLVSTSVKSTLKKIGLDSKLVRRVAISTYEAEMNVVMHAKCADVKLTVNPKHVEIVIDDEGKGIPHVEEAMEEGYTTATDEMRAMGFGSGMGLPNIKRNADELEVTSEVNKGTRVQMRFFV